MNRKNVTANFDVAQMFYDNMLVFFAYELSCLVYGFITRNNFFWSHFWLLIIFAVIFTLTMSITRMYNITTFYYTDRIITNTLIATVMAGMSLGTAIFLYKSEESSRLLFALLCVFAYASVALGRIIKRMLRSAEVGNGYTHIIFIGDDNVHDKFINYVAKTAIKIKVDLHIGADDPILNDADKLRELFIRHSANEVVLASDTRDSRNERNREILGLCERLGTTARVIMDICEMPNFYHFISSIGPYPVVTYHNVSFDKVQLFLKTMMDVIVAALGLLVVSPIMLVTAICIKLETPGPVFFKQERAGRNGKTFIIYKFRSMYTDADNRKEELMAQNKYKSGMMFKIDRDPRVTKVGAFIRKNSIDELPQLINVLKRDMSLVGTRPPTLDEVKKYAPEHWRRISIMPGITGMWQVSGRSAIVDFEEIVTLDKQYIDNWSLGLDISILFRTVGVLVSRYGAH